jgi:hypothetical protein
VDSDPSSKAIAGPKLEPKTDNAKSEKANHFCMIISVFLDTLGQTTYVYDVLFQERDIKQRRNSTSNRKNWTLGIMLLLSTEIGERILSETGDEFSALTSRL